LRAKKYNFVILQQFRQMKIIFCDNRLGGLLGFRREILDHFVALCDEVVLSVPEPESEWDNVGTRDIPDCLRVEYVPMKASGTSAMDDLKLLRSYIDLFRRERPGIIFCYTVKPNVYASIAASLCCIPCVCMVTGLGYLFAGETLSRRIGRGLYRLGLGCAGAVLTLNEANRDILLSRRFVRPGKLTLLPGGEGVDLSHYAFREDRFSAGDPVRFLMVSRVLEDKGYREFVAAARTLRAEFPGRAVFEILGPTAYDSPMGIPREEFEADLADGVFDYLGVESDPREVICRDGVVVVLPSYHEGMSRSLMEACAMGRPVIASDIPGCREMVRVGDNGYLCAPRSSDSLAWAMRSFLAVPDDAKEGMSRWSRLYAEQRFDVNETIRAYDALVSSHRP